MKTPEHSLQYRAPFVSIPANEAFSLEASHLIWVRIMKVKGPKNQADFIEVTGPPKDKSFIGPRNSMSFLKILIT